MTRDDALALDAADPLSAFRDRFVLPDGVIYLDGNSLGALPKGVAARLDDLVRSEWGESLIRGWNAHGWIEAPARIGAKLARLIGAEPHEVAAADSTSINVFKLAAGAAALRPGRATILSEPGNFPTDLYMLQGLERFLDGRVRLKTLPADEIAAAIDEDTAAVVLTHVHYKSGRRHDMAAITAAAHAKGALALWDLSHSAGVLKVDLNGCGADLAVGCGYKYLNGGPGAPAFLFVAERHQAAIQTPLTGWMGHAEPFAFDDLYRPAPGVRRQLCGTPPILGLAALESALEVLLDADLGAIEAKAAALGDLFIAEVEARCGDAGLTLVSPRDGRTRGGHVSFAHPDDGYAMVQALIAEGVIGDFRAPDVLRFGFAPLYLRYVDVWDAADRLADIVAARRWDQPVFKRRASVT
jgi:kynureninase